MEDDVLTVNEAWVLYYKLSDMHKDMLAFRQTKGITSIHSKIQKCLSYIRVHNKNMSDVYDSCIDTRSQIKLQHEYYSSVTADWDISRYQRYVSNTGSETKRDKDLHKYILAEYEVIKLLEN